MSDMRIENKTNTRNSLIRLFLVAVAIVLQLVWLLSFFGAFRILPDGLNQMVQVLSVATALWLYGQDKNADFKVPWMLLILVFPIVGFVTYFMMGRRSLTGKVREVFEDIDLELSRYYDQDPEVLVRLDTFDPSVAGQARLIAGCGYPVYEGTQVTYYSEAVDGLNAQIEAMKKAEKFIFMEYHAIEDGQTFQQIKDVLIERASAGVEVRIFYDDMGSISFINKDFIKQMESYHIQCRVFNPIRPWILIFMNNRDHRKITVIDGQIGFTGGYNLANEYFNVTHPYGYWKDTGIKLEGSAVNSLTLIFLEMWNAVRQTDDNMDTYLTAKPVKANGFVQPYADSPLDNEYLGEDVYINIVSHAKKYVYFVTPYLIITDEMSRALAIAAKRGVDVRIITPGIPDKQFTYSLTRSYYHQLVVKGIRIYEYTPGFCHAKMCISDDETATCGTINLDYRSLYLHFENGVFMSGCDAVAAMKTDFEDMFKQSKEVTESYQNELSMPVRTWKAILRLVAPLF